MTGTVLVTGAGRGLGLGFARHYAARGWRVLAGCRAPEDARDLARLAQASQGRVSVTPLDVTRAAHVANAAALVADAPLDLLISNAGIWGQERSRFGATDEEAWMDAFRVNCIAPIRLLEACAGALERAPRGLAAHLTSRMGSIADNAIGGYYTYRSSKAALNAAVRSAAIDLRPRGVTAIVVHPGWVRTDMGGPGATLSVEESVGAMAALFARVTPADSGRFFHCDGSELPW